VTSKPGGSAARRLGPYEFIGRLGAGGMGEVYRARDTRLGREVAIKVLPAELSADADRLRRFEKEARSASSLNHPNIVTIYEVERIESTSFIVMELVDGKTLREVLSEGALPVRRLLTIAVQIAEGLARAHSAGIIHRDLKPENVMVTKDGLVKILDFGLAKLAHPEQEGGGLTQGPTVSGGTSPGVVMGTVGYMSPEQASGHPVDFRSDQFSFGSLLYEMATGKGPFRRATAAQTLAAIIQDEPEPIINANPTIPVPLRWILERCLAKEPNGRYASTEDLARELATVRDHLSQISSVERALPETAGRLLRKRELLGWALAAVLALLGAFLLSRRPAAAPLDRLQVSLLPPPVIESDWDIAPPAVSPDGRHVVFRAQNSLWLRSLAEKEWKKLPGTEAGAYPFWSPDSQAIGFITLWDFKLKRIGVNGVGSQLIGEAPRFRGASWGADDTIVFGQLNGPLYRIPAGGGQPSALTRLDQARRELDHRWPYFLPDGRRLLYLVRTERHDMILVAGSLDSNETKILGKASSTVAYSPPGYLLSTRTDRALVAQPLDVRSLRLSGSPVSIAENVLWEIHGPSSAFSVSSNGVLVYQSGPIDSPSKLAWWDRSGRQLETFSPSPSYPSPVLSPDGTRVTTPKADTESGISHLWLHEFDRGTSTRLTFDPGDDQDPVWSPDGGQLAFSRARNGIRNIYLKSANGSGTEERLLASDVVQIPLDWSSDGAFLLYLESGPKAWEAEKGDLWVLPMAGQRKPLRVAQDVFGAAGGTAKISPDGHFLAYTSDESGRFELRVQTFPQPTQRWQISAGGGSEPRWRRDGKELFYVSSDNRLMAVQTKTGSSFAASAPRALFQMSGLGNYMAARRALFRLPDIGYDVARDGSRFLVVVPDPDVPKPPITVVFNWLAAKPSE
jgi:eukaryotic-like serine/threonine-protein kinase